MWEASAYLPQWAPGDDYCAPERSIAGQVTNAASVQLTPRWGRRRLGQSVERRERAKNQHDDDIVPLDCPGRGWLCPRDRSHASGIGRRAERFSSAKDAGDRPAW